MSIATAAVSSDDLVMWTGAEFRIPGEGGQRKSFEREDSPLVLTENEADMVKLATQALLW